jgi:hypothetical protein
MLDGSEFEFDRGETYRTRPDLSWGPPNLLCSGYRVFFPGVERLGRGVHHPPPSSAEVKESVELYLNPPPHVWAVMACSRVNFTFTFTFFAGW